MTRYDLHETSHVRPLLLHETKLKPKLNALASVNTAQVQMSEACLRTV